MNTRKDFLSVAFKGSRNAEPTITRRRGPRYKLGFSEIVALSQAQLNKTQAEIAQANAHYDYLKELAVLAYETGQIR